MYLYIEVSFAVIADCNVIIQKASACDATISEDSCCLLPSRGDLHVAFNLVNSLSLSFLSSSFPHPIHSSTITYCPNHRLLSKISLIQTTVYLFLNILSAITPLKKGFNHVISTSSPCVLGSLLHLSPSAALSPLAQRAFRYQRRSTRRLGVRNPLLLCLAMPLHHRIQDAALSLLSAAQEQGQEQAATPGERLETDSSDGWQRDLVEEGLVF